MPIFIAALIGGLVSAAGSFLGRMLIAAGIGIVSYTGINAGLDALKSQVQGYVTGMPADILPILYMFQLDTSISILFSAYAARLVIRGLTGGAVKRFVIK